MCVVRCALVGSRAFNVALEPDDWSVLKTRNWLAVFYPESCGDWEHFFEDSQIVAAVSPLHDADLTKDGELKKPHYHCIVCFDGPKSYDSVLSLLNPLGINTVKPCNSLHSSFAYLTHENSPDKAQYNMQDIRLFGGFDTSKLLDKTLSLCAVFSLIRRDCISNFASVIDAVMDNCPEMLPLVCGNSYAIKTYCDSIRRGQYL